MRHPIRDEYYFKEDEEDLLDIAVKAGIQLNCPLCSNTFKSARSFSVHMTDDHNLEEKQAELELQKKNKERKEKVKRIIGDQKRKEKEDRKRRRDSTYEAFVDTNNEIRVREPSNNPMKFWSEDHDLPRNTPNLHMGSADFLNFFGT